MAYGPPEPATPATPAVPPTPENTPWAIAVNQAAQQGLLTPANIQAAVDDPVLQLIAQDQALKKQQAADAAAAAQAQAQAQADAQAKAQAEAQAKSTPTPTPTPTTTNPFVASTAPGSVGISYGQASADLIAQVQQQNPELATALQNGTASVNFDADTGIYNLINTTTGAPIGGDYQVQVGTNGVGINIPTASGAVLQASVSTNQNGAIAPVTSSQFYNAGLNAGAGGFAGGGALLKDAVTIGLAFALPIAGEALASSLSASFGFAIPTSVGTAMASIATNVAQGQTLDNAIKNAGSSLISQGIISQVGLDGLTKTITQNATFANAINNMAASVIATASKGGNVNDFVNNAIAAGGGSLLGDTLQGQGVSPSTATALGRTIATTAVTGSTTIGLSSGASVLGQTQADANYVESQLSPILDAPSTGPVTAPRSSVNAQLIYDATSAPNIATAQEQATNAGYSQFAFGGQNYNITPAGPTSEEINTSLVQEVQNQLTFDASKAPDIATAQKQAQDAGYTQFKFGGQNYNITPQGPTSESILETIRQQNLFQAKGYTDPNVAAKAALAADPKATGFMMDGVEYSINPPTSTSSNVGVGSPLPAPSTIPAPQPYSTKVSANDYAGQLGAIAQDLYNQTSSASALPNFVPNVQNIVASYIQPVANQLQAAANDPSYSSSQLTEMLNKAAQFLGATPFSAALKLITYTGGIDPNEQAKLDALTTVGFVPPPSVLPKVTPPPSTPAAPPATPTPTPTEPAPTVEPVTPVEPKPTVEPVEPSPTPSQPKPTVEPVTPVEPAIPSEPSTPTIPPVVIPPVTPTPTTTPVEPKTPVEPTVTPSPALPNPYDPSKFDPAIPATYPTPQQDPNFKPDNPQTWPGMPSSPLPPGPSTQPATPSTPTQPPLPGQAPSPGTKPPPDQTPTPGPAPGPTPGPTPAPSVSPVPTTTPSPTTEPGVTPSPGVSPTPTVTPSPSVSPTTTSPFAPPIFDPFSTTFPQATTNPLTSTSTTPLSPTLTPTPSASPAEPVINPKTPIPPVFPTSTPTLTGTDKSTSPTASPVPTPTPTPSVTPSPTPTPTPTPVEINPLPSGKPDVLPITPTSVVTDYVKPKKVAGLPAPLQTPTGLTGITQGLGGTAGSVSVESGQPQQAVWNIQSLKLKEDGTPDYGALSSALGI